ncbi:hypothetical protein V6N11_052121 [Hibiscus sabdariffa]|uniref:Uncharacterized protein n=1 Tax=Hibiscus sabdariffa TaxID=183260 RepID=A0ABR2U927_9ROSI
MPSLAEERLVSAVKARGASENEISLVGSAVHATLKTKALRQNFTGNSQNLGPRGLVQEVEPNDPIPNGTRHQVKFQCPNFQGVDHHLVGNFWFYLEDSTVYRNRN